MQQNPKLIKAVNIHNDRTNDRLQTYEEKMNFTTLR